jgi:hypothetical protein
MRSWRVLLRDVVVDGVAVEAAYADVFLVVRDAEEGPGPNDWEATIRTVERQHLRPGRHELLAHTTDGHEMIGWAVLRFSDGHQHHFRGDGDLAGADLVIT